jgi:hypothetical protein
MLHRRLVREYESKPASSVSRTLWASTANLVRRLTGTTTPSWRNTETREHRHDVDLGADRRT